MSAMDIDYNAAASLKKTKKSWRHCSQRNRMEGKEYEGLSKGNVKFVRKPREMKDACKSKFCEKSSIRHCSYFSEVSRKEIFDLFWKMSWDNKKLYVQSLVECSERQRITVDNSKRSNTKYYFLKHNTNRIQVCRQMFLSTLALSEKMIRPWVCPSYSNSVQRLSEEVTNKIKRSVYDKKLKYLRKWLKDLPKLESHYRRKYTQKVYFEADFKSYKEIYDLYTDSCNDNKENDIGAVSFPNFMKLFKSSNYALFKPRNDQCDLCLSYKAKNLPQEEFENHRIEIDQMRSEKENDIENAKSGLCLLLCIDMQAVKLLPQSKANSSYYKMKLQLHNFTIYNVVNHESDNYIWDETEGNLVSSTFTTIIIKHLRNSLERFPEIHHIIIYSDGCFYQNRNVVLSNALLSLCVEKHITVEHKYLVVGHTQMECDSTHSLIERKIRNKEINMPFEFVNLVKAARKAPFSLKVHHLNHNYFLDYESVNKRYKSIRPGQKSGDPTVNMVRALAYEQTGTIYFKTKIDDNYAQLPQKTRNKIITALPPRLHEERLKVSKKKWQHLQDLKPLLPKDCHYFYDSIPFEN